MKKLKFFIIVLFVVSSITIRQVYAENSPSNESLQPRQEDKRSPNYDSTTDAPLNPTESKSIEQDIMLEDKSYWTKERMKNAEPAPMPAKRNFSKVIIYILFKLTVL